jgi:hypothetical protein
MMHKTAIVAFCAAMLLMPLASAATPESKCAAALNAHPESPYPAPAEHQAASEAAKNAYTICRSASVPAEERALSTRRWASILSQRNAAAAEALYRQAICEFRKDYGADSPALLPLLNGLMDAVVQVSGGPTGEAFELAEEIRRISEKAHGPLSESVARALLTIGRLHELNGNRATAETVYRDALTAAAAACAPRCGTLSAAYGMLRDLVKTDPARQEEANALEVKALESLPNEDK